ncbi:MAG: hypothetical protein U7123_07310 [Potamolinea sp.]
MAYTITIAEDLDGTEKIIFSLATVQTDIPQGLGIFADGKTYPSAAVVDKLLIWAETSSLPEAPYPDLDLLDTSVQQLSKSMDIQWKSPRIGVNLFLSKNNRKRKIAKVSLINVGGCPFQVINLLELIGTYSIDLNISFLSITLVDYGYGLPNASDVVTVHGSAVVQFSSAKTEEEKLITVVTPQQVGVA